MAANFALHNSKEHENRDGYEDQHPNEDRDGDQDGNGDADRYDDRRVTYADVHANCPVESAGDHNTCPHQDPNANPRMIETDSFRIALARIKVRTSLMQAQRQLEEFIVTAGRDPRLHELAQHVLHMFEFAIRAEAASEKCDAATMTTIAAALSSQADALTEKARLAVRLLEVAPEAPVERLELN